MFFIFFVLAIDNTYRKVVDLKFKRDYYRNKISQLKYLRDQQKQYLIIRILKMHFTSIFADS